MALVAHQGAEVTVVVLELLLEEGDGGGSVQDDPGLRGSRALAAAVRTTDGRDVWRPEGSGEKRRGKMRGFIVKLFVSDTN